MTVRSEKDVQNFAKITTAGKPCQAPYAGVSFLEDPCTRQSEYSKAPPASSELLSRAEEIGKTHLPGVKAPKVDKDQVNLEKTSVKQSSKGLRCLLKFGKKNHTSSSVDQSVDSQYTSGDGIKQEKSAGKMTPAIEGEVHFSNLKISYKSYVDFSE